MLKRCNLSIEDVEIVISHQANARLIEASMIAANLPVSKTFMTVEKYANTSGASIPITLHEARKSKRIKSGDIVVLVGFGGGLTWGANVVKWYETNQTK